MMKCDVQYADEFGEWWNNLDDGEQESVASCVKLLEARGVTLGYPYSSSIEGARHSHMRELRIQHCGNPYRVLYAFDPRRSAILLIGGCKTGNDRWYEEYVPIADRIYDDHITDLKKEIET